MRRSRWNASISWKTLRKPHGGSANSTKYGKSRSFIRPTISRLRRVISPNPPTLLVSPPTYSRRPYRSHTSSALYHFCPLSRCCATRPVERVPTSGPSIRLTVRKSPSRSPSQTSMALPMMLAVIGRPSSFARLRSIRNSAINFCGVITGAPSIFPQRQQTHVAPLLAHRERRIFAGWCRS